MADSPFIRDVPAARALDAWRSARDAAGCPARLPAMRVRVEDAAGLVTAEPVWATRSSPPFDAAGMDGIAVLAADTLGAARPRRFTCRRTPTTWWTPATRCPRDATRW